MSSPSLADSLLRSSSSAAAASGCSVGPPGLALARSGCLFAVAVAVAAAPAGPAAACTAASPAGLD